MEGELEPQPRPDRLRISDADRHRTAEFLREAAGEGRLDVEELEERLEATYAAKVYADLVPVVVDLPGAPSGASGPVSGPAAAHGPSHVTQGAGMAGLAGLPRPTSSVAILGAQDRKGVWAVGPTHTAFAMMAGIDIDLRQAVFTSSEVTINANAVMAGIDVIVNAHTRVHVEGYGIMGAFEEGRAKVEPEIGPESPLVRVRGVALMGAVTVVRKPMPGQKRKRLGRTSS